MRGFFGVEHACGAGEVQAFLAGDLRDRAVGREVAVQDHEVAVGLDRIRRADGRSSWPAGYGCTSSEVLGDRLAGDREAIAVQQAFVEQHLHQRPDAADVDQLGHRVFAARPQVGEHRHALARCA